MYGIFACVHKYACYLTVCELNVYSPKSSSTEDAAAKLL